MVASFSEQLNLKNERLLLNFVPACQKRKEVPFMKKSRDKDQKRKESPYMETSRDNDQKRCVHK